MKKTRIEREILRGERALFQGEDLHIVDSIFEDGESPLKEAKRIELENCSFKWKYPVWYSSDIEIRNGSWAEMARAGVWYGDRVSVEDSVIEAPKNFRRCRGVSLKRVSLPNAAETLWNCRDVALGNVSAKGDYFGMNSENLTVDGLQLVGGYAFDGIRHAEIRNAKILTKDAFWNSENVTVRDSYVSGEYLGWDSRNLTLENCTIESLQGMCYIENLVLRNCTLLKTNLAFEYSTVDVDVKGGIDSVKNPAGGRIRADEIGEIIMEDDKVDPSKTTILCRKEEARMDLAV